MQLIWTLLALGGVWNQPDAHALHSASRSLRAQTSGFITRRITWEARPEPIRLYLAEGGNAKDPRGTYKHLCFDQGGPKFPPNSHALLTRALLVLPGYPIPVLYFLSMVPVHTLH